MAKKGKGKKKMENEVIENTAEEVVTEETVQAVAEAIVEEANEQNVDVQEVVQDIIDESNEESDEEVVQDIIEESDKEKQDTENQEEVVNVKEGIVGGCNRLNVRTEANINSDVACVLNSDSRVYVYLDDSTDEFYKIKTQDNIYGYCKKDFIWLEMNS